MPFQLFEGSPVHETGAYYTSGRGGAGNYRRLSPDYFSKPPVTIPTTTTSTTTKKTFFGGRGGAGNVKVTTERAMFSFDEELELDRRFHEHHAPVYHIGRGGAGNIVPSDSASVHSSASSTTSSSPRSNYATSTSHRPSFSASSIRASADRVLGALSRGRNSSS